MSSTPRRRCSPSAEKLDALAAATADLLDLALETGDREAIARRAAQLRDAVGLEERI